jgi:hypothetical protein
MMSKKLLHVTVSTLAAAISISVFTLPALGIVYADKNFECAGKVDNGMVIFREFPVFHFIGQRLKIAGSDIFSTYSFEVCSESDKVLSFATGHAACNAGAAASNSLKSAHGTLKKNSGQVDIAGSQGLHGEYQCKEMIKK